MIPKTPAGLVLASSSPYRRALLERLGVDFLCASPGIDETRRKDESIPQLCSRLAAEKAGALATQYPDHILIGADQAASVENRQLEKPGNFEKAFEQLKLLSGQCVMFYTAVTVVIGKTGQLQSALDTTEVHVRKLADDEITRYLEREQPFDCAGSFKVEGLGISLFSKVITGDPTALIGLPLISLCEMLRSAGISLP